MYKFIFVCVLMGIVLAGCSAKKIEFNYQSQFDSALKGLNKPTDNKNATKSSNIYIYKYEDENKSNNSFGPSDMNFDFTKP